MRAASFHTLFFLGLCRLYTVHSVFLWQAVAVFLNYQKVAVSQYFSAEIPALLFHCSSSQPGLTLFPINKFTFFFCWLATYANEFCMETFTLCCCPLNRRVHFYLFYCTLIIYLIKYYVSHLLLVCLKLQHWLMSNLWYCPIQ